MDLSDEYIKMCKQAIELQKEKKVHADIGLNWNDGDFFHIPESNTSQVFSNASLSEGLILEEDLERAIWLPRQDQLQHSLFGEGVSLNSPLKTPEDVTRLFHKFIATECGIYVHLSFERMWLAFIMKHKFNKVWNGEDWVEDRITIPDNIRKPLCKELQDIIIQAGQIVEFRESTAGRKLVDFYEKYFFPPTPNIPPARCAICGGQITGDNWNESQGTIIHNECPTQEPVGDERE